MCYESVAPPSMHAVVFTSAPQIIDWPGWEHSDEVLNVCLQAHLVVQTEKLV